jgi:chitinase|tara:strand:+ start:101 stop:316 length:216 start_codon:yes stop_codon:yes gene_type:complete
MKLIDGSVVALKEITKWTECDYNQPNHTYFLNAKGKLVGYKLPGADAVITLKNAMKFDKARRKFITLKVTK